MGATLSNSISMLQVGGFTDFEELLSDARDECHAAVDAYLTLQVSLIEVTSYTVVVSANCMCVTMSTICMRLGARAECGCATWTSTCTC
jgi:hypothetical protein